MVRLGPASKPAITRCIFAFISHNFGTIRLVSLRNILVTVLVCEESEWKDAGLGSELMAQLDIHIERVRHLDWNLDSQVVLVSLRVNWGDLVKDKLAVFLRGWVLEIDLEIATGEHTNALSPVIVAQLDTIHVLCLDFDLRNELHLKLSDFVSVKLFAVGIVTEGRRSDFDKSWHATDVSIVDILHHAEEAL